MIKANSTRSEDWARFGNALIGRGPDRHGHPALNYVLRVGHTAKNIVVEEARRWGFELRPSKW